MLDIILYCSGCWPAPLMCMKIVLLNHSSQKPQKSLSSTSNSVALFNATRSYGSFDTADIKATITRDVCTTCFIVH